MATGTITEVIATEETCIVADEAGTACDEHLLGILEGVYTHLFADVLCDPDCHDKSLGNRPMDVTEEIWPGVGLTCSSSTEDEGGVSRGGGGTPPQRTGGATGSPQTGRHQSPRPGCIEESPHSRTKHGNGHSAGAAHEIQCVELLRGDADRMFLGMDEAVQAQLVDEFNDMILREGSINPMQTDLILYIITPILSEAATKFYRFAMSFGLIRAVLRSRCLLDAFREREELVRASRAAGEVMIRTYAENAAALRFSGTELLSDLPDEVQTQVLDAFKVEYPGLATWQVFVAKCYPHLVGSRDVNTAEALLHYLKREGIRVATLYRLLQASLLFRVCSIFED